MAKKEFLKWKNSKDSHVRNPIDPDYQVAMITFGMEGNEDLEFLQKMREKEDEKNLPFNPYSSRLALAENFYESLPREIPPFEHESPIDIHIER